MTDQYNQGVNSAETMAATIQDGQLICMAPDYSGCSMAVVIELIRQQKKLLRLIGVPQLGLQADLLIGAGCVSSIDAAAVTLGEFGQAPRFVDAVKRSQIVMHDSTCPVIHAGLQASEKGIPFMPLRGILGSDLIVHRPDWQIIDNPFSANKQEKDPILLVPAIKPEVALFHAPIADVHGNVWIGTRRELMLMAHAAVRTCVTVEKIVEHNLLQDSATAAGVIPALYISDIAAVANGADPVGLFGCYAATESVLLRYATEARTEAGFQRVLADFLHGGFLGAQKSNQNTDVNGGVNGTPNG